MPSNEVKHRKAKSGVTPNGDTADPSTQGCKEETKKDGGNQKKPNNWAVGQSCVLSSLALDVRTIVTCLSLGACFVLGWVVLQQNDRFIEVEEKYRYLYEKAAHLLVLEERFSEVSKKLDASEDRLKGALSSDTLLTRLEHDVASLNDIITAIQEDQHASSHRLQRANERFLSVTEMWQGSLASVTDSLAELRTESRSAHGRVTENINEAEGRLRALSERLGELEDGTRRNARVLEHTEEEDARRVQEQLDWNTAKVARLGEQLALLTRRDAELQEKLEETSPRAQECAAHLPAVEDAVRTILRLGADLSNVRERLEELALQVLGTEDSMLKALGQILEIKQALSKLQTDRELEPVLQVAEELGPMELGSDSGPDEGEDLEKDDVGDLELEHIRKLYDGLEEEKF